ncbi:MAG: T9SS type A sorting domain-containing protein [Flavobacteriales bacterium]
MKTIFYLLSTLAFATTMMAQPANDNVCNATEAIVDDGAFSGINTDATTEPGEVFPADGNCATAWCDGNDVENSVWYYFIAPANGAVWITTCIDGNEVDTQIAIWQVEDCADFSSFTLLGASDDMPEDCDQGNQFSSTMAVDGLTPGTTYYLQMDGYEAAEGTYMMQIDTGTPASLINFIHNSGDLTINEVDIRVNGELVADNLAFQTASTYLEIAASVSAYITICDEASVDDSAPLCAITADIDPVANYIAVVHGIVATSGYSPATPLSIQLFDGALLQPASADMNNVLFFNGSTDAGILDLNIVETSTTPFESTASGTFATEGYASIPMENLSLSLTDEDGGALLTACAPFGLFGGNAAVTMITSGFLSPADNSNGAPMGLYLVNDFNGEFILLEDGACPIPDNDEPCTATNLIVNAPPTLSTNLFASLDTDEVSPPNLEINDPESDCITAWCDGVLDATVWFTFEAPAAGSVLVSTCFESSFDTQVAVYAVSACDNYTNFDLQGANDDMEGGCEKGDTYASTAQVDDLIAGNVYYIQVDGWEGASGDFEIQVTDVSQVAVNSLSDIEVYPNPADDVIYFNAIVSGMQATLKDVAGTTHRSMMLKQGDSIQVKGLAAGIYLLQLQSMGHTTVQKIVVN